MAGECTFVFDPLGPGVRGTRYLWDSCPEEHFNLGRVGRVNEGGLTDGTGAQKLVAVRRYGAGGGPDNAR